MKIKTIDITAKEWFDRVNGNSYHSVRTVINYGMKDERVLVSSNGCKGAAKSWIS